MRSVVAVALILFASQIARTDDGHVAAFKKKLAEVTARRDKAVAESQERVELARQRLAFFENALIRRSMKPIVDFKPKLKQAVVPSAELKAEFIRKAKEDLERDSSKLKTESAMHLWVPFSRPPQVGEIGRFRLMADVRQVVGKDAMLIEDDDNDTLVMLRGVSTDGITDGTYVRFSGYFEVVGTEAYITVLGASKTVATLRPFDMKRLEVPAKP